MNKNIILVGLGPHAKRIYIKYLNKHKIAPKLIVDLKSQRAKVEEFLRENNLEGVPCYYVNDAERDFLELSYETKSYLSQFITSNNITHAIISTEPKAHYAYSMFFLDQNVSILMDKPITAPTDVINNISKAERISSEYDDLCKKYKMKKSINDKLTFSIQCQRRFQKGYVFVKKILEEIVEKYNVPITYIDIYHNDGMWNMPNEFVERENHPYKHGYGKLFHSGYHFIDLLTWLLDINSKLENKKINKCSIYSESYKPRDFFYNFNNENYVQLLHTNKFHDLLLDDEKFKNYGEIDVHSIINFYNCNNLITNCSLNLMQSGVSRRAWTELPKDAYKSNGRIRHERVNICVGPLLNIQVHSYQAYEIRDKEKHGGAGVGDIEHFDIYIFRNVDLIGGKPFEMIRLEDIEKRDKKLFIGFNEKARERCLIDFLNNVTNDSDILLHKQSIMITEMIYKSLVCEGKKMVFDFNLKENKELNEIGKVTDADFDIEVKQNKEKPIIRFGSRGIIINENDEIALFYKENKNEYKLPGGGIEKDEDPEAAFVRECEEEAGVKVEIIKELGYIVEEKSQENFQQLSFVYVGRKTAKLESLNLTEKEKEEGAKIVWLKKLDALEKMKECLNNLKASRFDNVYRTKFMVLRDIKILEHYINNN